MLLVQEYWENFDKLLAYGHDRAGQHFPAWAAFNRAIGTGGSVGIWHETYLVEPGKKRMCVRQHAEIRSGGSGRSRPGGRTALGGQGSNGGLKSSRRSGAQAFDKLKNGFNPAFGALTKADIAVFAANGLRGLGQVRDLARRYDSIATRGSRRRRVNCHPSVFWPRLRLSAFRA